MDMCYVDIYEYKATHFLDFTSTSKGTDSGLAMVADKHDDTIICHI